MAYIGNSPANVGNYQVVDDISSTFNGVLTSFALTASSLAINPAKSGQLLVSINGVLQEPDDTGTEGFLVSGSNIVFSSAPATGSTFWAVWQGQAVDIGTPSDSTVGTDQLSATGTKSGTTYLAGDNTWKTVVTDLVNDTTPQLGGDLDFQTHKATSFTSTGIDDNATSTAITIDSSERLLIGGTQATTTASLQIAAKENNINDGRIEMSCFTGTPASPSESKDWPTPSLTIRDYDSFTKTSIMSFGYPNDAVYQTGNDVWNLRLDGVGAATTSSSSTNLELYGPGDLRLGAGGAERMRIDSAGIVTMPNQPAFSAGGSGSIAYLSLANSTYVKVVVDSENFDRSNSFDPTNSRFTAPVSGSYQFTIKYAFQSSFSATHHRQMFYKNGSHLSLSGCDGYDRMHAEGIYLAKTRTELIYLTAGDYIEPWVIQDSGTTQSLRNCMSTFSGHLIG